MDPVQFDPDDEEFYGDMGSIGSAKFDTILTGSPLNDGSIPRGFTLLAIGNQGAGMDLMAKQFASVAEDPENTLLISTAESQAEILSLYRRYDWPTDIMVRTMGEAVEDAAGLVTDGLGAVAGWMGGRGRRSDPAYVDDIMSQLVVVDLDIVGVQGQHFVVFEEDVSSGRDTAHELCPPG